jgi:general secretion pathway protein N
MSINTNMPMKGTLVRKSVTNRYSHHDKVQENNVEDKLSFKQKLALFGVALFCIVLTVFVFAPAVWLSMYLESQTKGRFELSDAEGSLWNGSAVITVAVDKESDLTPILPGRFEWHLSPILLLGQIELVVDNPNALQQPLYLTGNFRRVQVSPNLLMLPAGRLAGLGAPLNTIKPTGEMSLSWDVLGLSLLDGTIDVNGTMKLAMNNIASALSQVKPLGSYLMIFDWHGQEADVDLKTIHGPMLLSGKGTINNGHFQFSGLAQSEAKQEENLANLLNLLGQRRPGADRNVISLEFK